MTSRVETTLYSGRAQMVFANALAQELAPIVPSHASIEATEPFGRCTSRSLSAIGRRGDALSVWGFARKRHEAQRVTQGGRERAQRHVV